MKYNPVDEEEVYPDESLKKGDLNIPEKLKIISYFGRFDYEKGFDIYISAVKEVLEKRDDIFFLFAGSGEAFHLADVIKNSKNVKFIQPQYKIKNYLNISDFIILASRRDPFPYLMLEAGILRKIFIGASVDGIAEFIEDKKDGLLFIPEDKNSLINKIIYAVDNYEEVKIFGNNLYKKVRENCSVKNYITFIENLYLSAWWNENTK